MSEPVVKRRPMIDLEEFERRLRQPLAAHQREDDPLAELARLVGEQEDPYKSVFEPLRRRPAAPLRSSWDQVEDQEVPAREPFVGGDFAAIEAGLLGATRREDLESLSYSQPTEFAETGSWEYAEASEPFPQADPAEEEIRSRRPLYVMAAIIVAGIAGIGASFVFKGSVSTPTEVATIRASEGPAKIHPETTAAAEIQSEDASVLGGTQQPPPVAAVSHVEQPADLSVQTSVPAQTEPPARVISGLPSGAASVPVPLPPGHVQPQPPSAEPASIASLIQPKKVKTVSVRPDGTVLPNDMPPPQVGSAAAPPAAARAAAPTTKVVTPKSTARVATTPKPPEVDANGQPVKLTPVASKAKRTQVADTAGTEAVPTATAASGSFAVQLAAPGSEQEARDIQVRLMKKYGAELAGFHPSIHKAEVAGKPVYRVRVVGMSSRDEATSLCQKIQAGGGSCFVAKN